MSWYYCLVHQQVEPEEGCANAERLGPYATEARPSTRWSWRSSATRRSTRTTTDRTHPQT